MSVKKEENGTWTAQCWHTDWSGKKSHKKKRGFATKKEALEWERSLSTTQSTMDKPLGEFMEIYFEDKKNELKDRTKTSKRYMMDTHIVPYFGNKKMSEITSSDIIKWQNIIIDKGYSQTYLRMIQNQMTALFTHACKIYDLPNNPCKKVKKMGRSDARRLDFWTETEYQKFINQMEPGSRYYVLFETLFWTGMREGELLALQKKDVDTANGTISVNKTYYRKN